jgi:hypothetical protein
VYILHDLTFRTTYRLYYHGDKNFLPNVLWMLVTANVPSSPILITLMMETIRSFERSVLTRITRRHIPEDSILRGKLSYSWIRPCLVCWSQPRKASSLISAWQISGSKLGRHLHVGHDPLITAAVLMLS